MRKVDLRMNEEQKYRIIKKLVESDGNKTRTSKKMNCTVRTVNRYIHKYKENSKEAFIHGNRNRKPSCTFDEAIKLRVLNLYQDIYYDCNVQHFSEFLLREEGIDISSRTLLTWLKDIDILSPKARRITKKTLKARINRELVSANKRQTKKLENQ